MRIATVALFITLLGGTAVASAEGPSREEYVATLESMCKPGSDATQRAMKGVRDDVRADRMAVAAQKFNRSAGIYGNTIKRISRVTRPPADVAKLSEWLGLLRRQESYLREIAREFRAERAVKGQRLIARFIHNGNVSNNVVIAFEFDYCRFKFSRYGG